MPSQEKKAEWPKEIIRRGERPGSICPDYIWWQEVPPDETADELRSVGYEVVSVVPAQDVQRLVEEIEGEIERCHELGRIWAYEGIDAALAHYRATTTGERS